MPLEKTAFHRKVIKTKRVGDTVWVLLERSNAWELRQWIAIPEAEYASTVRCRFVSRDGASRDDPEP